jgi:hypothetical protein
MYLQDMLRASLTFAITFTLCCFRNQLYSVLVGRDGVVNIATRHGPGTFRAHPDRPWGSPSLLYNGYRLILGHEPAVAWRQPPTSHLAPRLKKEYSYIGNPPPPRCAFHPVLWTCLGIDFAGLSATAEQLL